MATKLTLQTRITGKDDASGAVKTAEGSFRRFGNFLKARFVITLGDITNGLRKLTDGLAATINAAAEQEDAVRTLDQALAPLGRHLAEEGDRLAELAQLELDRVVVRRHRQLSRALPLLDRLLELLLARDRGLAGGRELLLVGPFGRRLAHLAQPPLRLLLQRREARFLRHPSWQRASPQDFAAACLGQGRRGGR